MLIIMLMCHLPFIYYYSCKMTQKYIYQIKTCHIFKNKNRWCLPWTMCSCALDSGNVASNKRHVTNAIILRPCAAGRAPPSLLYESRRRKSGRSRHKPPRCDVRRRLHSWRSSAGVSYLSLFFCVLREHHWFLMYERWLQNNVTISEIIEFEIRLEMHLSWKEYVGLLFILKCRLYWTATVWSLYKPEEKEFAALFRI